MASQQFAKLYSSKKRVVGSSPTSSASWENANWKRSPRGGKAAARLGFERAFWAKKKRIYQSKYGSSRFVLEMLSFLIYFRTKAVSQLDLEILSTHELVRAKTHLCFQFRGFSLSALPSGRAFFVSARHILRLK